MKKRTSKILSILLAFALIVSAGDVVRAEDVDGQKTETQEMTEVEATEPETEQSVDAPEITADPVEDEAEALTPVTEEPKTVEAAKEEADETSEEGIESFEKKNDETLDGIDMSELSKEMTAQFIDKPIPVKMAVTGDEKLAEDEIAGIQYTEGDVTASGYCGYSQVFNAPAAGTLDFAVRIVGGNEPVYYGVYRDANMTQKVEEDWALGVDTIREKIVSIPSAGTYYIGVYSRIPSAGSVLQKIGRAHV